MKKPRGDSPNPTDKHIGSRVRIRRMQLNMSQSALAEPLGLTFQQIQKYEKGTNRIGGSRMQQIADILQVPPGWFYEGLPGSGAGEAPTLVTDFLASRDGLAIAQAVAKLPEHVVHSIRKHCEVLVLECGL